MNIKEKVEAHPMPFQSSNKSTLTKAGISLLGYYCFVVLVISYLIFIFAASFYGIDLEVASIERGKEKLFFSSIHVLTPSFHNLRDIATNILLYMPLGFFWASAIISKGKKSNKLFWGVGVLVSLTVETLQAFVGRHSDLMDVISNSGGFVTGFVILNIAVKRFQLNPSHLLGINTGTTEAALQTFAGIRFIFMTVVYVVSILPLNISVAFSSMVAQLTVREGQLHPRIILDPLFHFDTGGEFLHSLLLKLLIFIPLAFLTYSISSHRSLVRSLVIMHCLLFAVFIEISKIFVLGATTDISVVLLAPIVAYVVCLILERNRKTPASKSSYLDSFSGVLPLGLYLLFLVVLTFSPYDFEISASAIKRKFLDSNFIPFKLHFTHRSISGAIDIVREFLVYVPLGVLLFPVMNRILKSKVLMALVVCIGFSGGFAVTMELAQLAVVGRYVDITDPMLAMAGVVFGIFFRPLILKILKRNAEVNKVKVT